MIEQMRRVRRHVRQGIRHRRLPTELGAQHQQPQRLRTLCLRFAGKADVSVVIADHSKSLGHQGAAEVVRPQQKLCADPHDEQQRRVRLITPVLIGQRHLALFGHATTN